MKSASIICIVSILLISYSFAQTLNIPESITILPGEIIESSVSISHSASDAEFWEVGVRIEDTSSSNEEGGLNIINIYFVVDSNLLFNITGGNFTDVREIALGSSDFCETIFTDSNILDTARFAYEAVSCPTLGCTFDATFYTSYTDNSDNDFDRPSICIESSIDETDPASPLTPIFIALAGAILGIITVLAIYKVFIESPTSVSASDSSSKKAGSLTAMNEPDKAGIDPPSPPSTEEDSV